MKIYTSKYILVEVYTSSNTSYKAVASQHFHSGVFTGTTCLLEYMINETYDTPNSAAEAIHFYLPHFNFHTFFQILGKALRLR